MGPADVRADRRFVAQFFCALVCRGEARHHLHIATVFMHRTDFTIFTKIGIILKISLEADTKIRKKRGVKVHALRCSATKTKPFRIKLAHFHFEWMDMKVKFTTTG